MTLCPGCTPPSTILPFATPSSSTTSITVMWQAAPARQGGHGALLRPECGPHLPRSRGRAPRHPEAAQPARLPRTPPTDRGLPTAHRWRSPPPGAPRCRTEGRHPSPSRTRWLHPPTPGGRANSDRLISPQATPTARTVPPRLATAPTLPWPSRTCRGPTATLFPCTFPCCKGDSPQGTTQARPRPPTPPCLSPVWEAESHRATCPGPSPGSPSRAGAAPSSASA